MDYDEYKNGLKKIRKELGENIGIEWSTPLLQPVYDSTSKDRDLLGWKLTWAGPFEADEHYICVREDWSGRPFEYHRRYFSYHYGPYHQLDKLESARWKAVVARIDDGNYEGRGCHIHDNSKDRRIHQDELDHPSLWEFSIETFIEAVIELRKGRTVTQAFDLRFKK